MNAVSLAYLLLQCNWHWTILQPSVGPDYCLSHVYLSSAFLLIYAIASLGKTLGFLTSCLALFLFPGIDQRVRCPLVLILPSLDLPMNVRVPLWQALCKDKKRILMETKRKINEFGYKSWVFFLPWKKILRCSGLVFILFLFDWQALIVYVDILFRSSLERFSQIVFTLHSNGV